MEPFLERLRQAAELRGRERLAHDEMPHSRKRASSAAQIGHVSSHSFRHTYRSWLDAVGTSAGVQQKMMRHSDIRTTFGYGDVVTDEMTTAGKKVAQLAFHENRAQTERTSI